MKKPIIAIMYDFDKTLCTRDMQEYQPTIFVTVPLMLEKMHAKILKPEVKGPDGKLHA